MVNTKAVSFEQINKIVKPLLILTKEKRAKIKDLEWERRYNQW